MVGVVACAGVRERHLDVAAFRSHEPHVHVLEVAAAAFSVRVRVVAVRLDVVLGDRLAGLVGGEDLGAVGHGDLGRGVGAVVHAHVDRVTLARGQVGELLGDLHVTGQAQHGVVGAFDLGLAGAGDGPVVLEGVLAAVEAASTTCMPSLHLTEICFSEPLVTTYGVSASAVSEILPPETATVFSLVLPWSVSWYTLTEARFCQSFGRVHSVVPPGYSSGTASHRRT